MEWKVVQMNLRGGEMEMIIVKEKGERHFQSFLLILKNVMLNSSACLWRRCREQTAPTSAQTDRHQMCADVPPIWGCLMMMTLKVAMAYEKMLTRFLLFCVAELPLPPDADCGTNCGTYEEESTLFRFPPLCLYLWWWNDESKSLSDPFMSAIRSNQPEKRKSSVVQSGTILNRSQDRNYRRGGWGGWKAQNDGKWG